jgi:hypothetical protein
MSELIDELEDLLRKEIDVSKEQEIVLKKRLKLMNESLEELPSTDPAYFTLNYQIEVDLIALDELKRRREQLVLRLKSSKRVS